MSFEETQINGRTWPQIGDPCSEPCKNPTDRYEDVDVCGDVPEAAHADGRDLDAVVAGRQVTQQVTVPEALVAVRAHAAVQPYVRGLEGIYYMKN